LKVNRRFGGTRLHLQSRVISQARNQRRRRYQPEAVRYIPEDRIIQTTTVRN
jgi:hypothetical protein